MAAFGSYSNNYDRWDYGLSRREMERYRDELLEYKKRLTEEMRQQQRYYMSADWGYDQNKWATTYQATTNGTSTSNKSINGLRSDKVYYDEYPIEKPEPTEEEKAQQAKEKRNANIRKLFWHRFLATGELPFSSRLIPN